MSLEKFTRTLMPVATADLAPRHPLPQELIIDILLRLPAKSIGKFRRVSTPWHSLLCDPIFIKAHLAFHLHDREKLIIISSSISPSSFPNLRSRFSTITLPSSNSHARISEMLDPLLEEQLCGVRIVGSCNGLVLVTNDGLRRHEFSSKHLLALATIYLINPTTMELLRLPKGPLDLVVGRAGVAFGYDSLNDDYKIVWPYGETRFWGSENLVIVFSLRNGTWRRHNCPYGPTIHSGVFLNGSVHWLAQSKVDDSLVIAALDLSTEEFKQVPWPSTGLSTRNRGSLASSKQLVVLGGCLAMVVEQSSSQMDIWMTDIWMMKDYGVGESWTKFRAIAPKDGLYYKPICLLGEDDVVLDHGQKFVVHNLRDGTTRDMLVAGTRGILRDVVCFLESLVSPAFYSQKWKAT